MRNPASGFDFLAPFYDFLQHLFFGRSLRRAQAYFLDSFRGAKNVLVVGGGTGFILLELLQRKIGRRIVYIDISRKMLELTKRRIARFEKNSASHAPHQPISIEYVCASVLTIEKAKYDLIITPFVLDCFTDARLQELVPRLSTALAAKGSWLFSDFHIPKTLARHAARALIRLLYFCFNCICRLERHDLPHFDRHFLHAKLQADAEKYFLGGLIVSRIYRRAKHKSRRPSP